MHDLVASKKPIHSSNQKSHKDKLFHTIEIQNFHTHTKKSIWKLRIMLSVVEKKIPQSSIAWHWA